MLRPTHEYTFDKLLTNRIGMGPFQYKNFIIVSIMDFLEGFEWAFNGILVAILAKEWNLDDNQIMVLAFSYLFGKFIGGIIQMLCTDVYGRKRLLMVGSLALFVLLGMTIFARNVYDIFFLRLGYGIVHGVIFPLSLLYMAEMTPEKIRGRGQALLQIMLSMGQFYFIVLAFIFLENLDEGNWRALCICTVIPTLISFIGSMIYLDDNPRFLLTKQNFN